MDKLNIALRGVSEVQCTEDNLYLVDKCSELEDDLVDGNDSIFYYKHGNINQWRIEYEERGGHPENIPVTIKDKTIYSIIIQASATIKATDAIINRLEQHSSPGIETAYKKQKNFIISKEVELLAWLVWDAADDLVDAYLEMELTKSQLAQMKIIMKVMSDVMHTNELIREDTSTRRCLKCSGELADSQCGPCAFEFIS